MPVTTDKKKLIHPRYAFTVEVDGHSLLASKVGPFEMGPHQEGTLELKRVVDEDSFLLDWLHTGGPKTITVTQLTRGREPVTRWTVHEVMPIRLTGFVWSADAAPDEPLVESATLSFRGLTRTSLVAQTPAASTYS